MIISAPGPFPIVPHPVPTGDGAALVWFAVLLILSVATWIALEWWRWRRWQRTADELAAETEAFLRRAAERDR